MVLSLKLWEGPQLSPPSTSLPSFILDSQIPAQNHPSSQQPQETRLLHSMVMGLEPVSPLSLVSHIKVTSVAIIVEVYVFISLTLFYNFE